MRDFSDLDREAARNPQGGLLWNINGRWSAAGDSCALAPNGYGRLVPTSSVANGRVQAALRCGAYVGVYRDGHTEGRPIVAVRRARPDDTDDLRKWSRALAQPAPFTPETDHDR